MREKGKLRTCCYVAALPIVPVHLHARLNRVHGLNKKGVEKTNIGVNFPPPGRSN